MAISQLEKMTKSLHYWNEYIGGRRYLLLSLSVFIALSAIKLWYWSSSYTLFLGDFCRIETVEVTWQTEKL